MSLITDQAGLKVSRGTLEKWLIDHEGQRPKVHKVNGIFHVGIGHNLEAMSVDRIIGRHLPLVLDEPITQTEQTQIFNHDLDLVIGQLDSHLDYFKFLSGNAQHCIIDMTFNMGIGGLLKFKGFLKAIRENNVDEAISHMQQSLWWKQVQPRPAQDAALLRNERSDAPVPLEPKRQTASNQIGETTTQTRGSSNQTVNQVGAGQPTTVALNTTNSNLDGITVEERFARLYGRTTTWLVR